jgi:chemotaxis protein CheD
VNRPAREGAPSVVGVGEYKVSSDRGEVLVTYSLGSCLGVAAYDPRAGVGGLLHFKLPHSGLNQEMAQRQPAVFGDTGMTAFLGELLRKGASKPFLEVRLAGGAKSSRAGDLFNIGERNLLLARRFLWMNGLLVLREDTGGEEYRTVRLEMAAGKVTVKGPGGSYEL